MNSEIEKKMKNLKENYEEPNKDEIVENIESIENRYPSDIQALFERLGLE